MKYQSHLLSSTQISLNFNIKRKIVDICLEKNFHNDD